MSLVCCTSKISKPAPRAWTVPAARNTQSPTAGAKVCKQSGRSLLLQCLANVHGRHVRLQSGVDATIRCGPQHHPGFGLAAPCGLIRAACSSVG